MRSSLEPRNLHVGVVIVAYNSGDLLVRCVESLINAAEKARIKQKIVIIDNHPNKYDSFIEKMDVSYISLQNNPGFGTANNTGLRFLIANFDSDYFFLINPDAYIPNNFYTEFLGITAKLSNISSSPISPKICFPKAYLSASAKLAVNLKSNESIFLYDPMSVIALFNSDGSSRVEFSEKFKHIKHEDTLVLDLKDRTEVSDLKSNPWFIFYKSLAFEKFNIDYLVQNAGSKVDAPFSAGDLNTFWLSSRLNTRVPLARQAWCGAAVLLPSLYVEEVGGFDEKYFLYYEDTDYSMRGARLGHHPYLVDNLIVFHEHSASTNVDTLQRSKAIWRSRSLFMCQNFGFRLAFVYSLLVGARALNQILRKRTTFRHFYKILMAEVSASISGVQKGISKRKVPYFHDK
jgi:GT2 family glycosyltransferase